MTPLIESIILAVITFTGAVVLIRLLGAVNFLRWYVNLIIIITMGGSAYALVNYFKAHYKQTHIEYLEAHCQKIYMKYGDPDKIKFSCPEGEISV